MGRDGRLAVTDVGSGQAVGFVMLHLCPQPGGVGLSYWLAPAARGRGCATRAVG